MKVLYDHQVFTFQKFGGISRYFAQVISNLPENVQTEIAIRYSNNEYIKNLQLTPEIEKLTNPIENFLPEIKFRGKRRIFEFINKFNPFKSIDPEIFNKSISIELLKKQDFEIFHPTYYDDYFLEYIGNKPFVLTIHDMIHELYPEMLKDTDAILRKSNLATRAAHIIAVSEKTKRDIIELLNVKEEKITVIYHACSIAKSDISSIIQTPNEYILYVGDRLFYKNFMFFVLAIQTLLNERKTLHVICTGRSFNNEEQTLIKKLGLEGQFLHFFVQESQFYELYNKAKAFIFPSYYEGFGIPILEAFEAKCPVILSNSSCFPEIAGEAAIYFEPKSKKQLVLAIERILEDQNFRQSLIEKGEKRIEAFSWMKSAQQTIDVYRKVLNSR